MALTATPPLHFSDIKTEFSGSNNFSDYYRGGAYVPDHANTAGIPTSGSLSFSHFLGASATPPAPSFTLTDPTPSGSRSQEVSSGTAYAYIQPGTNGHFGGGGSGTLTSAFGSGSDATGKYFRWSLVSGTIGYTNMTQNVWYPVGSGYYVGNLRGSPNGSNSGVASVQFANDSGGSGATTAGNITFTATYSIA